MKSKLREAIEMITLVGGGVSAEEAARARDQFDGSKSVRLERGLC
jgi:hypothetical protein